MAVIQECIAQQRYIALPHFLMRLDQRGMFWPDVQAILEQPVDVRADGWDSWHRPRWIVSGRAANGLSVDLVCVLDADHRGNTTVFITIYWQE